MTEIANFLSKLADFKVQTDTTINDFALYYLLPEAIKEQGKMKKTGSIHEDYMDRLRELYLPIINLAEQIAKVLEFKTVFNDDISLNCTKTFISPFATIGETVQIDVIDTEAPEALFHDDNEKDGFTSLGFTHIIYVTDIQDKNYPFTKLLESHGYEVWAENESYAKLFSDKGLGIFSVTLRSGNEIYDELKLEEARGISIKKN
ncbi:hypothetical protein QZM26_10360 [Burkholderia multivorans]|nr:hypothetical protein [Burkholderia multivorans]MDN8018152.1 hypothetical protein [Burkholderia multivorans]